MRRGNGSQVEERDWWGSPARLGGRSKKKKPNPSHSLFKAANVSFEEIILFGHLIALGNYEPLQGTSGITRTGYQRGRWSPSSSSPSSLLLSYHRDESIVFGVSSAAHIIIITI